MNDDPTTQPPNRGPDGPGDGPIEHEPAIPVSLAEAIRRAHTVEPADESGAASRVRAELADELARIAREAGVSGTRDKAPREGIAVESKEEVKHTKAGPKLAGVGSVLVPVEHVAPIHRWPWVIGLSGIGVAAAVGVVAIIGLGSGLQTEAREDSTDEQPIVVAEGRALDDAVEIAMAEPSEIAALEGTAGRSAGRRAEPSFGAMASRSDIADRSVVDGFTDALETSSPATARERPRAEAASSRSARGEPEGASDPRDANLDGTVDVLDAFTIARTLAAVRQGEADGSSVQSGWDINGDGGVDDADVEALMVSVVTLAGIGSRQQEVVR